jgi:glutamate-1-semialdehyde 2,1-aminomutase
MKLFDAAAVQKLNALTSKAIQQLEEVIKMADIPASITGAGSMFRIHLTASPPTTYREAYQSKETGALINELLDHMYYKENILMINTFACMFSTVLTQNEVDRFTEAMSRTFRLMKPKIHNLKN